MLKFFMVQSLYGAIFFNLFKNGNGGHSLLSNVAAKEYAFDTLRSSLPRLWSLGKQYFAQLEEKRIQNLKKQQAKCAVGKCFLVVT